jgi:hypothetical protein
MLQPYAPAREFHWEKPFDSVGPIYNFDMTKAGGCTS